MRYNGTSISLYSFLQGGILLKKFAIFLSCAILVSTISGCTLSETKTKSNETSTMSSEKIILYIFSLFQMILKLTTTQKNLTYHYLKQNLLRRFYRLKSKKTRGYKTKGCPSLIK